MITDHDCKMAAKGYRFRLTPTDKSFEPLYAKNLSDIGPLMREMYPEKRFDIEKIFEDHIISDLLKEFQHNREQVVQKLLNDHPALTAFFISQGMRDEVLSETDVNHIVNTMLEDRRKCFQE